jgi:hypothetical protein
VKRVVGFALALSLMAMTTSAQPSLHSRARLAYTVRPLMNGVMLEAVGRHRAGHSVFARRARFHRGSVAHTKSGVGGIGAGSVRQTTWRRVKADGQGALCRPATWQVLGCVSRDPERQVAQLPLESARNRMGCWLLHLIQPIIK